MHTQIPLDVRPEIADAVKARRPVVAFASTPIAYSVPWPENLEIVRRVEELAREEGALLAVVAVWQGRPTVGLAPAEVETLSRGASTMRASRRDLTTTMVRHATAATTVAASMYLACRAGIPLVATGAIGGAAPAGPHMGFDISADLVELARTPVAVVSAGARRVLDLSRTIEILESYSVPVIGYGTDFFPVFYQDTGSQPVSVRANKPGEVAALLAAHWGMDGSGVVVAQPTPRHVALSPDELQPALIEVMNQATMAGVRAKDLPPFLMARLNRLTGGRVLRAYQAILEANVRLAAQVARELTAKTEEIKHEGEEK